MGVPEIIMVALVFVALVWPVPDPVIKTPPEIERAYTEVADRNDGVIEGPKLIAPVNIHQEYREISPEMGGKESNGNNEMSHYRVARSVQHYY